VVEGKIRVTLVEHDRPEPPVELEPHIHVLRDVGTAARSTWLDIAGALFDAARGDKTEARVGVRQKIRHLRLLGWEVVVEGWE